MSSSSGGGMSHPISRQITKYDGQTIYVDDKVAYELGNYLGGGASGSVYQALDAAATDMSSEKSVAIKILNPVGFKSLPYSQISKCHVATKGLPLSAAQASGQAPLTLQHVWWLVHSQTKCVYAAYEDAHRGQLRELTLPKCIEVWGWAPLGDDDNVANEDEQEKRNQSETHASIDGVSVRLPRVAPKYVKWLRLRRSVCREVSSMIQIGAHSNIIALHEVLEQVLDSKSTLFLVLELVSGGELFERMKMSHLGCPDDFARRYFVQLLSGIDYCHAKGVVHRDLKPENLLLSDGTEQALLKIADFGLSAVVFAAEHELGGSDGGGGLFGSAERGSEGSLDFGVGSVDAVLLDKRYAYALQSADTRTPSSNPTSFTAPTSPNIHLPPPIVTSRSPQSRLGPPLSPLLPYGDESPSIAGPVLRRLRSVVGSPHYIAPEVAGGDADGYDGAKVDMWSAGVILYSLLTGRLPFGSDVSSCPRYKAYRKWLLTEHAQAAQQSRVPPLPDWFFPPSVSPLAASLVVLLLHTEPSMRLTAKEARKHPWCMADITENVESTDDEAVSSPPSQHPSNAALSGQGQGHGADGVTASWQAGGGVRVTTPPPHSRGQQGPPVSPLQRRGHEGAVASAVTSAVAVNAAAVDLPLPLPLPPAGSGVKTPPPTPDRRSTNNSTTSTSSSGSGSTDSPPRGGTSAGKGERGYDSGSARGLKSKGGVDVGAGLGMRQSQKAASLSVLEQQYAKEREAYRDFDVRSGSASLVPSSRSVADRNPYSYRTPDSPLDNSVSVVSEGSPEVLVENEGPPTSRKL